MTRATIDFGIDLGTSNSSVAVFSGERVEIIRNNENNEITPSVVRYLPMERYRSGKLPINISGCLTPPDQPGLASSVRSDSKTLSRRVHRAK